MSKLQQALSLCQEAIQAFTAQEDASAIEFNNHGHILLDLARTALAASVNTFKQGLKVFPGDEALQRGLDEALLKGQGNKIDAIMNRMDLGISRCMELVSEIRGAVDVRPSTSTLAVGPLNVLLISANTGSCFEGGDLEHDFLSLLHEQVNSSNADLVAVHFQEMCGKEWKTRDVKVTCEEFSSKLCAGLSGFWCPGTMFYPPTGPKDNSFTALATILFVRRPLVVTDRFGLFDFKTQCEVPISSLEDSSDLSAFIHHEAFPNSDFPEIKAGRKGYLHVRVFLDGTPIDLINLHLFHDASNVLAFTDGHPSTFAKARKRALQHVLRQVSGAGDSRIFMFGDFNFRLDLQRVVNVLLGPGATSTSDDGNITLTSVTSPGTLKIGTKKFVSSEPRAFVERWREFQAYDVEALNFAEFALEEQSIDFPPSYPFEEEPGKPHDYMPSRCPGWCDRIVYTKSAAKSVSSPRYRMMGHDQSVGDHKPIALHFVWKHQ